VVIPGGSNCISNLLKHFINSERKLVIKNLKTYEKKFDKADKELAFKRQLDATKAKRALRSKFRERVARLKQLKKQQKEEKVLLNNGYDSDDETNYTTKEVAIETILSTKEEVV